MGADLIDAHAVGYGGFPELVAHPSWVNTNTIDMVTTAILIIEMPNIILDD